MAQWGTTEGWRGRPVNTTGVGGTGTGRPLFGRRSLVFRRGRCGIALESAQFRARVTVSTYHSGPPSLLFVEMARESNGWRGEKEWAALEDELRLTASSDSTGHTTLRIIMRSYSDPADWRLEATVELEAGQLEELSRKVTGVFSHVPTA